MKHGVASHPKTLKLARLLDLKAWGAVGLLELLAHWTSKYAPGGDIGRWSPEEIAEGVAWGGNATDLVDALVDAGFVERHEHHGLAVHDWAEHATDGVHRDLARQRQWFWDGTAPKVSLLYSKDRAAVQEFYASNDPPEGFIGSSMEVPKPAKEIPGTANGTRTRTLPVPAPNGAADAAVVEAELPEELDTEAFREIWVKWFAYRRKRKLPKWIDDTTTAQLKKLVTIGHDGAIAAIEHSIAQGYSGIFQPNGATAPKTAEPEASSLTLTHEEVQRERDLAGRRD